MDLSNIYLQILFESLFLMFLFGMAACAWFSFIFKMGEAVGGKTLYHNLSAHFTQSSLFLTLPVAAGLIFLFLHGFGFLAQPAQQLVTSSQTLTPLYTLCALAATPLLQIFCLLTRKKMRKNSSGAGLLLLLTALMASYATLASLYFLQSGQLAHLEAFPALALFAAQLPVLLNQLASPPAWSLALLLAAALCAFAIFVCMAWLLARRTSDDFGRDYYNFALKRCAWPAFMLILAALIGLGLLLNVLGQYFFAPESGNFYLPLAAIALQGLCCLICFVTALSASPLRHKLGIILGLPVFAASIYLVIRLTHELQAQQLLS